MKYNKARGPDNFPIDIIKICDDRTLSKLVDIFNDLLSAEILPHDWLQRNITLIFKKGKKR